jgi:hypothetical protein
MKPPAQPPDRINWPLAKDYLHFGQFVDNIPKWRKRNIYLSIMSREPELSPKKKYFISDDFTAGQNCTGAAASKSNMVVSSKLFPVNMLMLDPTY